MPSSLFLSYWSQSVPYHQLMDGITSQPRFTLLPQSSDPSRCPWISHNISIVHLTAMVVKLSGGRDCNCDHATDDAIKIKTFKSHQGIITDIETIRKLN